MTLKEFVALRNGRAEGATSTSMSSFKPFPLATATLFAAALVASTACSSSTPDTRAPGGSSSNLEGSAGAEVCSGKACGVLVFTGVE